jgi:enoyl-CoA hydratase
MSEHILVSEIESGVCTITLNRPDKKNALSIALRDELSDALDTLQANKELKVLVITGASTIFSAGFDLGEFQEAALDEEYRARLWASSDRYHHTVLNFPLPTIAAVNGPAIAGGFDLATLCDVRVAVEEAYFSHPEIAFGDVVYSLLHDLVGGSIARELCLTGRKVTAAEALEKNLVSRVVTADELAAATNEYASMIAQAPRENLINTKAKILKRAGIERGGTLSL